MKEFLNPKTGTVRVGRKVRYVGSDYDYEYSYSTYRYESGSDYEYSYLQVLREL